MYAYGSTSCKQTHTLPDMIPLARPGIPSILEKWLEIKYLSQEALSSGPSQNCFQRYVVFSTRAGARLGSKVGPIVLFSNGRNTVCQNKWTGKGEVWLGYTPTIRYCVVGVYSLLLFDLQPDGSLTLVVDNFMAADCSVSQHAHAADGSPSSVSQTPQELMDRSVNDAFVYKSTLTGNLAVWRRRPALRHRWKWWRRWRRPRRWRPVCWRTSRPRRPARTSGGDRWSRRPACCSTWPPLRLQGSLTQKWLP